MHPFERFTTIRAKLGAAIVIAVAVAIAILYALLAFSLPSGIVKLHPRHGIVNDTVQFVRDAWWLLLIVGGLSGLAALAFVRLLARGMTQPLRDMADATARMAHGDYSVRVQTSSRDEVGRLAESFNSMAADLEGVERLRRDLIANVSHELKTPISAIRAHLENLLEGIEQPSDKTIGVMLRQSERLSSLVEQVLDLSRLESGQVPIVREQVALRPVAEQAVAEVRLARGVEIRNDVPETLPLIPGDRIRLHQVLFNILDNAARLSPPGGAVRTNAAVSDGVITVWVDDEGPGLRAEQIPLVFERFYRADASRSRPEGGAGLGLAIARSIVEAHGGRIWAEPRAAGGMRFSFTLPLAGQTRAGQKHDGITTSQPPTEPRGVAATKEDM